MKNLTQFETKAEYDSYITGPDAALPNVSYVDDMDEVKYKLKDYTKEYFQLRAMTDGTFNLQANGSLTRSQIDNIDLEYCYNDGPWDAIDFDSGLIITVQKDDTIKLRGNNSAMSIVDSFPIRFLDWEYMIGKWAVSGNIMSLLDSSNFATMTTVPENCFYAFFAEFYGLVNAKLLTLPATTLNTGCYNAMFAACQELVIAPAILPATTLAPTCYCNMFSDCVKLVLAPKIAATTLAEHCCSYMFGMCSSLQTAPALLANTLVSNCYAEMFAECQKLSYIKCLADVPAPERGSAYTNGWTYNVSTSGTFVLLNNSLSNWPTGTSGIPCDWQMYDESGQPLGTCSCSDPK